jgi:hypothetical protein
MEPRHRVGVLSTKVESVTVTCNVLGVAPELDAVGMPPLKLLSKVVSSTLSQAGALPSAEHDPAP